MGTSQHPGVGTRGLWVSLEPGITGGPVSGVRGTPRSCVLTVGGEAGRVADTSGRPELSIAPREPPRRLVTNVFREMIRLSRYHRGALPPLPCIDPMEPDGLGSARTRTPRRSDNVVSRRGARGSWRACTAETTPRAGGPLASFSAAAGSHRTTAARKRRGPRPIGRGPRSVWWLVTRCLPAGCGCGSGRPARPGPSSSRR